MTIYHCQWDTGLCIFFSNSVVIWKQLSCQVQKKFSSVKQYKKTHNEKFGKWHERVQLISRLWWLHGCGYLWVLLNLAWQFLSPLPSRCALWKLREGWVQGPFLLAPASGFLLITQIRNRCAETEHLIFIPQCVFFKWQMFFKAKRKYHYIIFLLQHSAKGGGVCVSKEVVHPVIWTRI